LVFLRSAKNPHEERCSLFEQLVSLLTSSEKRPRGENIFWLQESPRRGLTQKARDEAPILDLHSS
jgi:hypothetical protein